MSIPEPKSFNGDPGETGRFAPSGSRREPGDDGRDYYGRPCGTCGRPCHRIYTLADVGIACSPKCREAMRGEYERKDGAA